MIDRLACGGVSPEMNGTAGGAPDEDPSGVRFVHATRLSPIARAGLSRDSRAQIDAAVVGLTVDDYRAAVNEIDVQVEQLAFAMLDDEVFAAGIDALPLESGDRLVALGDSITADSFSWAELLSAVFRLRARGIEVINLGISGDTTAGAIERMDIVAEARPRWVVQLLGTNDVRRHGLATSARMASQDETMRNFAVIGSLVQRDIGARLIRMTPTAIISDRAAAWQPFRAKGITWRAGDAADLASTLCEFDPSALDLHSISAGVSSKEFLELDGVHPTAAGQEEILRALVAHLASMNEGDPA